MSTFTPDIAAILDILKTKGFRKPELAIILGSGLGGFEKQLHNPVFIPYSEIPGFPQSTVAGHSGMLAFGDLEGLSTLVFSGRFHHYEGYPFSQTILPVQLAAAAGAKFLLISNAAGGINPAFKVGDLMVISEAITIGQPSLFPPHPQSSYKNPLQLGAVIMQAAAECNAELHEGTYLFTPGPSYETPAEIRFFGKIGADAVGMSTYPEILAAAEKGLLCGGISLITNAASGLSANSLDHNDIKDVAETRTADFSVLVKTFARILQKIVA